MRARLVAVALVVGAVLVFAVDIGLLAVTAHGSDRSSGSGQPPIVRH